MAANAVAPYQQAITIDAQVYRRIEDVEAVWQQLSIEAVESPGQSYAFIRHWVTDRNISEANQRYVVGYAGGQPVALLPLQSKRAFGVHAFTWFPGTQVGCYAPVADYDRLAAMGPQDRARLWRTMLGKLGGDIVFLRAMPKVVHGHEGLLDELGVALTTETLYRAEFSSWEQCDHEQRSRTRRKHDRQQGERLAALGKVDFAEVSDPAAADAAVQVMFRQRSARFKAQGIRDPFVCDDLIGFYRAALDPKSGVDVRIHTLTLDNKIVAVRYNILDGDRMFCLISSMSECESTQAGSPGKQCLLRVMQSVFDGGVRVFDMGAGFTDEKRHWCNVQIPLREHYVARTPLGAVAGAAHRAYGTMRARAKANGDLKVILRQAVSRFERLTRRDKPRSDQL
jgi:CelD/BcsL family acetyltransferase involved in cellulose biosynthesis